MSSTTDHTTGTTTTLVGTYYATLTGNAGMGPSIITVETSHSSQHRATFIARIDGEHQWGGFAAHLPADMLTLQGPWIIHEEIHADVDTMSKSEAVAALRSEYPWGYTPDSEGTESRYLALCVAAYAPREEITQVSPAAAEDMSMSNNTTTTTQQAATFPMSADDVRIAAREDEARRAYIESLCYGCSGVDDNDADCTCADSQEASDYSRMLARAAMAY